MSKNKIPMKKRPIAKGGRKIQRRRKRIHKGVELPLAYLSYPQARDFCRQFVESLLEVVLDSSSETDKQKIYMAQKEIMLETLKEKYEFGVFEAAVLLLHLGMETLNVFDTFEEMSNGRIPTE